MSVSLCSSISFLSGKHLVCGKVAINSRDFLWCVTLHWLFLLEGSKARKLIAISRVIHLALSGPWPATRRITSLVINPVSFS